MRGFVATRLFATSSPSITKMEVAPESATAWFGAMVIALIYCSFGMPYMVLAVVTDVGSCCGFWRLLVAKFDMTTVTSSSSATNTTVMFWGLETKQKLNFYIYVLIPPPTVRTAPAVLAA